MAEIPREPDRFEERAKELCLTEWRPIAAALRAEHDETLEQAARECECIDPRWTVTDEQARALTVAAKRLRAMKSPAAAPAAEKGPDTIPHMICPACGWSNAKLTVATGKLVCHHCDAEREYEPDRVAKILARYFKTAPPSGPAAQEKAICKCPKGMCACDHHAPAPLLPRVLRALETWGFAALAAELRAYIAERERETDLLRECNTALLLAKVQLEQCDEGSVHVDRILAKLAARAAKPSTPGDGSAET